MKFNDFVTKEAFLAHQLWLATTSDESPDKAEGKRLVFTGLDMCERVLSEVPIRRAKFVNCDLRDAGFSNCDLIRCQFQGCDLRGAYFGCSDLLDAVLSDCDLRDAYFGYARMRGAVVSGVGGRWTNFERAELTEADLFGLTFPDDQFNPDWVTKTFRTKFYFTNPWFIERAKAAGPDVGWVTAFIPRSGPGRARRGEAFCPDEACSDRAMLDALHMAISDFEYLPTEG
jgi:hypothetical protein